MYPRAVTIECRNLPPTANGWPHGVHEDPTRESFFRPWLSLRMLLASSTSAIGETDRVQVFDTDGTYLDSWGLSGAGQGDLLTPTGIKVDRDGNIWVVDRGNNRVQKFTRDGEFLATWGTQGDSHGQFGVPTSIAFDSDGNFYVSEVENSREQIFNSGGEYLSELAPGSLAGPHGLAFDSNGNLYVADTGNNFVRKFSFAN